MRKESDESNKYSSMIVTIGKLKSTINDLEKNERLIVVDEFRFYSNSQKLSTKKDPESVLTHKVYLVISDVTLNKARG